MLNTNRMVEEKKCVKCEEIKHNSLFYKRGNQLQSYCKSCMKKYHKENSNRISKLRSDYYYKNKKKLNDYRLQYEKERQSSDSLYKFSNSLSKLIRKSINKTGSKKKSKTSDILGLTPKKFREYLEDKFKDGMSWQNYGDWHIDHIIPMASAKNEFEAEILNHHLNLQPMWAEDNLKKSDSYKEEDKEEMIRVILNTIGVLY